MRKINKINPMLLFALILIASACFAEETDVTKGELAAGSPESAVVSDAKPKKKPILFQGRVISNDINIRSDSSASSEVICKINRDENVDVLSESYDWYKIRLPKTAPAFINRDFVELADDGKGAFVIKDNVNIRLRPDTSSPILGRVSQDEELKILEIKGDWYKIEPVENTFGWIHKTFLTKEKQIKVAKNDTNSEKLIIYKDITVEGLIKPKIIQTVATHKLIAEGNKLYLLTGDKEELSSFNHRKAKITGKTADPAQQENPIIKVEKIEGID